MIRVVVADDHQVYRAGVRAVLAAAAAQVEVVGEASTGDEAVAVVAALEPDAVLMDVRMPGMDGIEATRMISRAHPQTAVLVLTMLDDDTVVAALAAGARGYLLKDATVDEIVHALESAVRGETLLAPSAATRLGRALQTPAVRRLPELTEREEEVLRLIARGHDNRAIAGMLHLSDKTVRNYVSEINGKLGVRSRTQAVVRAHDAGLS